MKNNNFLAVLNSDDDLYEFIPKHAGTSLTPTDLYSLKPIGVGTPFVEGLSSYLARLAAAHMVSVSALLRRVIVNYFPGSRYNLKNTIGSQEIIAGMNGMGVNVSTFVDVLEKLTGRLGLQNLTMQSFSWLLSDYKLLSGVNVWCPYCLQDQRAANQTVYYPLLWGLEVFEKCPVHRSQLLKTCPYCGVVSSPLTFRTVVGFCSKCNAWLGSNADCRARRSYETGSDFFVRLFEWHNTIEFERNMPTLPSLLRYLIGYRMKKIHDPVLNRQVSLKKKMFGKLLSGQMLPTLGVVLWIAKIFKMDPFDVLTMDGDKMFRKDASEFAGIGLPVFNPDKVNWLKMHGLLRDVATSKASSMRIEDIAKVYKCPPGEIISRYPELCNEVTKRFNRLNIMTLLGQPALSTTGSALMPECPLP
ncbi:MAG: TniQ family protein [Oryzomonas sp.]|uniref:TniQ family protein n=1 Tax=Oryzomonas sp. TaxID=2855186 RepID=UPI00284CDABD|nr:TniQ family protein [Oryzomonas sp.]MDR3580518.1 TniQ family protein [Oryzomonas sp.]